ncbi:MAG: hypothetical protein K6E21_01985 [Bacilli bacterium]|nr:hypothetical protein [Bacilli bacterium]
MKKIYILTGPSGAGASTAKFVFEELGFYILENFPAILTNDLIDKVLATRPGTERVCLIPRIAEARELYQELKKRNDFELVTILLDCSSEELMHRYTLSRHIHPNTALSGISLEKAIEGDLELVNQLKGRCDLYIDTSKTTIKELRTTLYNKIENLDSKKGITTVKFVSFGMKNGIQKDIDMMIDCRILPNPYWVESLKEKTGEDLDVIDYLNSYPETGHFLEMTIAYLEYHFAVMQKAGRGFYVVGVACSGGQHRSTYVANYLKKYFEKKYKTLVFHRDCPELNK